METRATWWAIYELKQIIFSSPNSKCHEGQEKPRCEICNEEFDIRTQLNSHFISVHHKGPKYKCEICTVCTKTWDGLRSHISKGVYLLNGSQCAMRIFSKMEKNQ